MNNLATQQRIAEQVFTNKALGVVAFRENVTVLEQTLLALPGVTLRDDPRTPLKHRFAPGLYCREIFIPKGYILTTAIHKTEHIAIISQGKCLVATENGVEFLEAPYTMITKIGTKRAIHVVEDMIWTTVHAIDAKTPEEATAQLEFKDFQEYEEYLNRGTV